MEEELSKDSKHKIQAVLAVHTETSTGVTSRISDIRRAIDKARHPALLMVDAVSSLACTEFLHDDWGVDVTISASQKGLMLPPGLSFNAVSEQALARSRMNQSHHSYWQWEAMASNNAKGYFPTRQYQPSHGLDEALNLLLAEGLDQVFARHSRLAAATRGQSMPGGWKMSA